MFQTQRFKNNVKTLKNVVTGRPRAVKHTNTIISIRVQNYKKEMTWRTDYGKISIIPSPPPLAPPSPHPQHPLSPPPSRPLSCPLHDTISRYPFR